MRVSYHKIIYYIFVIFVLGGGNVFPFKIHDSTLVVCKYVVV